MTQWALPDANNGTTNWTQATGDSDSDWFDEFDEGFGAGRGSGSGPDDDTSRWQSPGNPSNESITTSLAAVTDPGVNTGHVYRTRNRKQTAGGAQIDIDIFLLESGAQIATATFTNISETYTTRDDTLSGSEADSITNYANLEIQTRANNVGGGTTRRAIESAHEFECPDAAAGSSSVSPSASLSPSASVSASPSPSEAPSYPDNVAFITFRDRRLFRRYRDKRVIVVGT